MEKQFHLKNQSLDSKHFSYYKRPTWTHFWSQTQPTQHKTQPNSQLTQLLFEEIQEPVFDHIQHGVRPNLSSIQILALTNLGSNRDIANKPFKIGRDICLMFITSLSTGSTGLRNA